jgi:hypothetical protein
MTGGLFRQGTKSEAGRPARMPSFTIADVVEPPSVILYELNEVPWEVVDAYIARKPGCRLAQLVQTGQSVTTVIDDPVRLAPWRTWPSFHTSRLTSDHHSIDLGQDPATFEGTTLWDAAERAGLKVGLFGPMQSWPARTFKNGGFYVPDGFSRDAVTEPPTIERFQDFNLRMTRESYYSSDGPLRPLDMARVGLDLVRRGISSGSVLQLLKQLGLEQTDPRQKAARPIMQVLPCFDLYWRLHRRVRPELSIFFTNHVATIMHRYWGDAMAGYESVNPDYEPDPTFATLLWRAMDATDRQLATICAEVDRHPSMTLLIMSSMGQHAIYDQRGARRYVLEDPVAFARALALGPTEPGVAMYPMASLALLDGQHAQEVARTIGSVTVQDGSPLFRDVTVSGRTVQFGIALELDVLANGDNARLVPMGSSTPITVPMAALGVNIRERLGGSNTAQHVPEGIGIAYGRGVRPDERRKRVDLLDVAPSILVNLLGVSSPPSMSGRPSLFAAAGQVPVESVSH